MSEEHIDHEARATIRRIELVVEKHVVACGELNKRYDLFDENMHTNFNSLAEDLKDRVKDIKLAFDNGISDLSMRHSNAIRGMVEASAANITGLTNLTSASIKSISENVETFKRGQNELFKIFAGKQDEVQRTLQAQITDNHNYIGIVSGRVWTLVLSVGGSLILSLGASLVWSLGRGIFHWW